MFGEEYFHWPFEKNQLNPTAFLEEYPYKDVEQGND
jgi:hypothetical protein